MTATNTEFSGKFTISTLQGLTWTLTKDAVAKIELKTAEDENSLQRFNTYGDGDIWLQASNGLYLVYDPALLTYTSTQDRGDDVSVFQIEEVQTNIRITETATDDKEYYVNANGSVLERIPKDASPPDSTLFTKTQITPGLADIKPGSYAIKYDLSYAFLEGANFKEVNFTKAIFSYANVKGADLTGTIFQAATCIKINAQTCDFNNITFSGADATGGIFESATFYSNSTFSGSIFNGANLRDLKTEGSVPFNGIFASNAHFDGADLREVAMNSATLGEASFVNVDFRGAQVSNTKFIKAVLNRCDFRDARVQYSQFDEATMVGIDFSDSEMNRSTFVGANLTNAILGTARNLDNVDFSNAIMIGAQLQEVDFVEQNITINKDTNFTQAAMDGVNLQGYKLDECIFLFASLKGASLDKASFRMTTLTQADLSYATITGNVDLVGANLSNAKLEGTKLNGAQFGPLTNIGSIAASRASELNNSNFSGLLEPLALGADKLRVEPRPDGFSWSIVAGEKKLLAYQNEQTIDVFEVSETIQGAVLSNAFMPNAVLKEANLFAVDMSGAQWYGGAADASGANMELVNLTNANVATMDFTQAILYGANFSFANMIHTNFYKAQLIPTTGQKPVSMAFASIQGTKFEEASIYSANLTNAAVSLVISNSNTTVSGDLIFEMQQSYGQFLDQGFMTSELIAIFADNGITTTEADTLVVLSLGSVWMLRSSQAKQYILFLGQGAAEISVLEQSSSGTVSTTAPDIMAVPLTKFPAALATDLNQGVVNSAISDAFEKKGYPLVDDAGLVVVEPDKRWTFRNMYVDNTVVQQGYGQFELLKEDPEQGNQIKLYGAAPVVVMRTSSGNTSERVNVQFGATALVSENMNKSTTTPSGLKFGLLSPELPYEYLMSPGLPPAPPQCVPSPTRWCP